MKIYIKNDFKIFCFEEIGFKGDLGFQYWNFLIGFMIRDRGYYLKLSKLIDRYRNCLGNLIFYF